MTHSSAKNGRANNWKANDLYLKVFVNPFVKTNSFIPELDYFILHRRNNFVLPFLLMFHSQTLTIAPSSILLYFIHCSVIISSLVVITGNSMPVSTLLSAAHSSVPILLYFMHFCYDQMTGFKDRIVPSYVQNLPQYRSYILCISLF